MSVCFCFLKLYRGEALGRINPALHIIRGCSSSTQPNKGKLKSGGSKWGYISHGDNVGKQDKETMGLYHLNTIHLPQQLETNLNEYLRNFPSKRLVDDALKLSRHLLNRGRPTERTWTKYKEAKEARKSQGNVDAKATQDSDSLRLDEDVENTQSSSINDSDIADTNQLTELIRKKPKYEEAKDTKKPKMPEYKVVRYQKRESAACAADRIPASYGATLRVLHEISKREKDFQPETVLDFGSGLGTATWAAHELWKDYIKIYQCVDISPVMNEGAEYLLRGDEGHRSPPFIPRVYFKEYLPVSDKVTYDVVMASYSLSEIPFQKTRKAILENLWRKTNNFLVIVERGNNEGFDITMEARNLVAENENHEEDVSMTLDNNEHLDEETVQDERGYVFSPCPHDLICPRSDINTRDHPCNFEQRVQLSFAQRRTSLKKYGCYNELFSYVVLRKADRSENEIDWPRILRPVRLRKRHVICKLCSKNGSLQHKVITRRKDSEIYKCVRHRTKWGDLLPLDVENKNEELNNVDIKTVDET